MKSLEVIQKIVKVLRILAKIAYIFCIIGAVASAIGAASLFAIDENSEIWKKALEAVKPDTIDLAAVRCTCLTGVFVCAAGAVLSWFSKRLFEDELAAGTPFDRHICKDVLKVGIIYLAVSVVSAPPSVPLAPLTPLVPLFPFTSTPTPTPSLTSAP